MSLRLRPQETQKPAIFIDPLAAHRAGYEPLHGPPEPVETAPRHHTFRGLAMTALAGYAMYKTGENMPNSEVMQFAVMPATLAVTGLRREVTGLRQNRAWNKRDKARTKLIKARSRADDSSDIFTRVMDGISVPYPYSMDDMRPQSILDKAQRAGRRIRHPFHKYKPTDSYGPNTTASHKRKAKKAVNKRNDRTMMRLEAQSLYRWNSKPHSYDPDTRTEPFLHTSEFGKPLGYHRFYQLPKSNLEVRGYRDAYNLAHHALHKVHSITDSVHRNLVAYPEHRVNWQQSRYDKAGRKILKLEDRKQAIANREDRASKLHDGSKRQVQVRWDKSKAGYKAAPAAFREGQQGTNVPDTRTQRTINKAARGAGLAIGTVKREYKPSNVKAAVKRDMESIRAWRAGRAAEAGRPTKEERKQARRQQKEDYKRQNQNGGVV